MYISGLSRYNLYKLRFWDYEDKGGGRQVNMKVVIPSSLIAINK